MLKFFISMAAVGDILMCIIVHLATWIQLATTGACRGQHYLASRHHGSRQRMMRHEFQEIAFEGWLVVISITHSHGVYLHAPNLLEKWSKPNA